MADTIRERIIAAMAEKCADIKIVSGFATDIGQHVYRAAMTVPTDMLPAISIIPGVEESSKQYGAQTSIMPVRILALARHFTTDPSVLAEQMLGDIIACMLEQEYLLPFTNGSWEPTVGDMIFGATSLASATVLDATVVAGSWGAGTAAGTLRLRDQSGTFIAEALSVSGHSSIALCDGDSVPGPGFITACSGLADEVTYAGGGTDDYPESIDIATTVTALFQVKYRAQIGNPYEQPA